jgi:hypothetical protein
MRTISLVLASFALLAAGCTSERASSDDGSGGSSSVVGSGGVWLIALGTASDGGGSATCNENISDADCYDTVDPPDPDPHWTGSVDADASPELFFVQILAGGGSDAFLIVDDQVYPGEISGSQMLFQWTHTETEQVTSEHDSGYAYSRTREDSHRTRFELERDGATLTGRRIESTIFSLETAETDEWDSGDVGFSGGQLDAWSYLDGDPSNSGSSDDCSGGTCSVTITSETAVEYSLTGSLTDYDDETYDLLRGVGQNAGADS